MKKSWNKHTSALYHLYRNFPSFCIDQTDKAAEVHVIIFLNRRWMSLLHKQMTNETTAWWNSSRASTTTRKVLYCDGSRAATPAGMMHKATRHTKPLNSLNWRFSPWLDWLGGFLGILTLFKLVNELLGVFSCELDTAFVVILLLLLIILLYLTMALMLRNTSAAQGRNRDNICTIQVYASQDVVDVTWMFRTVVQQSEQVIICFKNIGMWMTRANKRDDTRTIWAFDNMWIRRKNPGWVMET